MLSIPLLHPGESPADRARRLTEALAAAVLSDLVQAGIVAADLADAGDAGVRATLVCRRTRVRVVVRVLPWESPSYEPTSRALPKPGTIAARILALCKRDTPISARALARRLGRKYNSYFRGVIKALRDAGRLRAIEDGYVLA